MARTSPLLVATDEERSSPSIRVRPLTALSPTPSPDLDFVPAVTGTCRMDH
ncbi:MAG: hypothetical protein ACXWQZ_06145 [Ktedonobacterales bacterium]